MAVFSESIPGISIIVKDCENICRGVFPG